MQNAITVQTFSFKAIKEPYSRNLCEPGVMELSYRTCLSQAYTHTCMNAVTCTQNAVTPNAELRKPHNTIRNHSNEVSYNISRLLCLNM